MKTHPSSSDPTAPGDFNYQLRTGLNDIIGYASLLQLHARESDRESIEQILRSGRQMLDLIGGTLPQPEENVVPRNGSNKVHEILYVEDNDANFTLVERILETRADTNLHRARTGGEALARTSELHPDLILLDLNLPDFPGAEVIGRLRANPETSHIPVVVISADATPSQIERLLTAGARNYLTKPFSLAMLLVAIDDALSDQL